MTLDLTPRAVLTRDGARLAAFVHEPSSHGADTPTVVVAHGWTLSHRTWRPVLDRLAGSGARLVAWDQRGHGDSTFTGGSRRPQGESVRRLGEDLHDVIAATAPSGPLLLGGHSMGGMTVMAFAGLHPQLVAGRVRGVLLASTAVSELRGAGLPLEARVMRVAERVPARSGRVAGRVAMRGSFGTGASRADVQDSSAIVARTRLSTTGGFYRALMELDEREAAAGLAGTSVDVVVGTRDRLTPPRAARAVAEGIPGARLHVEEGAGHMTTYERPELLAGLLAAHL